jgi:hypothetical protein
MVLVECVRWWPTHLLEYVVQRMQLHLSTVASALRPTLQPDVCLLPDA